MDPMSKLFDKALDKRMPGPKKGIGVEIEIEKGGKEPSLSDLKAVASPEEADMLDALAEKCGHDKGGEEGGDSEAE